MNNRKTIFKAACLYILTLSIFQLYTAEEKMKKNEIVQEQYSTPVNPQTENDAIEIEEMRALLKDLEWRKKRIKDITEIDKLSLEQQKKIE